MRNKLRFVIFFVLLVLLILGLIVVFSPYKQQGQNEYPSILTEITIDCNVQDVFKYLGNSDNASDWSSFVDHITPINDDVFPDGTENSIRKCFKQADENGITWEEEIVEVIPNKLRRLTIYNLNGFIMQADALETEQIYTSLSEQKTQISFALFFGERDVSLLNKLKMIIASYRIQKIFRANLANIKMLIEKIC